MVNNIMSPLQTPDPPQRKQTKLNPAHLYPKPLLFMELLKDSDIARSLCDMFQAKGYSKGWSSGFIVEGVGCRWECIVP